MKKFIQQIIYIIVQYFCLYLFKLFYPYYQRPRVGYIKHYQVLSHYFFMQKIVGFSRMVPWPVDFRSQIRGWQHIQKGIMCDPGDCPGVYINAFGGLKMGDNVGIAANSVLVTTNHDKYDHRKTAGPVGIEIGNNVWIGANCVILPGTIIGDEVTIGAGCVVSGVIPSKSTVTRGDNHLRIYPKTKEYGWDIYAEKLT
jgi:acetyltransferase-like isoleucine patch superfamily enzyme